jgi:hypothetical protein
MLSCPQQQEAVRFGIQALLGPQIVRALAIGVKSRLGRPRPAGVGRLVLDRFQA